MGYTNVTKPIIVSVTKAATFSTDNYLRRMAVVSAGDSTLAVGQYKEVTNASYGEILTKGTELEKKIVSFFSAAGNKSIVVIEVGNGTREAQCLAIKSFLDSEELRVFNILVPDEWYQVKMPPKIYQALIAEQVFKPNDTKQNIPLVLDGIGRNEIQYNHNSNDLEIDELNLTYTLKNGKTELDADVEVTLTTTIDGADEELGKITFCATASDVKSQINFAKTIAGEVITDFPKLLLEWNDISKENIFFLNMPKLEDPAASDNFPYFKGLSALMLVANNCESETFDTAALVCGKTANSIFDISSSTPATALNYKQVDGVNPYEYNSAMKTSLIDTPATFVSNMAGNNVILNGLCADGKAWDYYYYWWLTEYRVHSKVTTLLLNGANNPVSAIKFNQDGIDTISSNIVAVLKEAQEQGVITNFAKSYDQATGTFTDSGSIVAPTYYEYIRDYPDEYAKEVLGGISCYIQIGKFVRQVQWNVSLGA